MRKYIAILFLFVAFSCQKKETLDATFRMEVKGYIEEECYTLGEAQNLYLWSSKSWPDKQVSALEYRVDPTLLESYNAEEGLNLKLLPDSCYLMEQTHFEMSDDDEFAKFKVKYWPEKIIRAGGSFNKVEYALPLRLWANGVPQDERYASVVVGFLINPAEFTLFGGEQVTVFTRDLNLVYNLPIVFGTNYNNKEWIKCDFKIDMDLVQAYNEENGTNYLPLPNSDKAVTWLGEDGELERDVNKDSLSFYVDFQETGIDEKDINDYMLPVVLTNISSNKCELKNNVRYFVWEAPSIISQSFWNVSTTSSSEGVAGNLADNNLESFWVWNWGGSLPEEITYLLSDYNNLAVVEKIQLYARRYDMGWKGPKDMEIYVTKDGTNWDKVKDYQVQLAADGAVNTEPYYIVLDEPTECLGVKIKITTMYSNGIGFFEIYMHGQVKDNPNPPVTEGNKIPQSSWNVKTTSSANPAILVDNVTTGIEKWWLWDWYRFPQIASQPEYITYMLKEEGKTVKIEKVECYAANGGNPWKGAKDIAVQITQDGTEWKTVKNFVAPELKGDLVYDIELDTPVSCTGIRLVITSGYSDGIAFYEICMHGSIE